MLACVFTIAVRLVIREVAFDWVLRKPVASRPINALRLCCALWLFYMATCIGREKKKKKLFFTEKPRSTLVTIYLF